MDLWYKKEMNLTKKEKFLSKDQILISVDRLTRFKNPKEKYLRVFFDVILTNGIYNYKKQDLEKMLYEDIKKMAEIVLNNSIQALTNEKNDFYINTILKDYENSVFICTKETNELIENKINYNGVCNLIDESAPVNLRWLKSLKTCNDLKTNRSNNCLKFPIEKVILAEGLTEEILLPAFSKILGFDFYKEGIQIIPAGGKNQVVKLYYKLAEELRIPIFVLLDKDAEENIKQIKPKLRNIDKIHLISCGEFEDLLPKSLIIKSINSDLTNFALITENDIDDNIPETKNLENIFKEKGLHEFKKADFAKLVRANLNESCEISDEIKEIIQEMKSF